MLKSGKVDNNSPLLQVILAAMKKKFLFIPLIASLFFLSSSSSLDRVEAPTYVNYGVPIAELVPPPINAQNFSLLVQKSSYTLFLKYNGRIIKSYPCVFGSNPVTDKMKQGDMCTPEGNFTIIDIREHFIWGYFMEFDYPNHESWEKYSLARTNGLVNELDDIGGDVGIHGVVDGLESFIDNKNNWTEGCVSMKNADLIDLATNLAPGTPVKIVY